MKRIVIALLCAVVLSLALAGSVLADEHGIPNTNAGFGQMVKGINQASGPGSIGDILKAGQGQGNNMAGGRPWSEPHNNPRLMYFFGY